MNAARKIIALLIILFIGIPALILTIWTVGFTNAAVSPEFLVDTPQQIIADVPDLIDEIFAEGQDPEYIKNKNIRAWFKAADETGTRPSEVLSDSGILAWLEDELSDSLEQLGDTLRGRRRPRALILDLKPLKESLSHAAIEQYLLDVVENFPPCEEVDLEEWIDVYDGDFDFIDLPPCRPDPLVVKGAWRAQRWQMLNDMPDDVDLLENTHIPSFGVSRVVSLLSYGIFLIPLSFLIVGALIAATSPGGFFRWLGMSLLVAGFIAWALAFFTHHAGILALDWAYRYSDTELVDLERLVMEKTFWFQEMIVSRLFNPVQHLAGIVCLIGLVIFAVSFIAVSQSREKVKKPSS